jgi:hypothetical protein
MPTSQKGQRVRAVFSPPHVVDLLACSSIHDRCHFPPEVPRQSLEATSIGTIGNWIALD